MPEAPADQAEARTLLLRRDYPDTIEEVWSAFTTSERLGRWFGTFTGEGGAGGTVSLTVTGEVDAGGEVAEPVTVTVHDCAPPHRLVVEIPENDNARSWLITVTLAACATGTTLQFEQHLTDGLEPADVEGGWNWYLDRLSASLRGASMPEWAPYKPER